MDQEHLSMADRLLQPLNNLESSLNALVQSLTTTTTYTAAPSAADGLITADEDLTQALELLKSHQNTHQTVLQLRAEKAALESRLKDTINECERFRSELRSIDPRIMDLSDDEDDLETAELKPVDYETLLAFASRIGRTNTTAYKEASKESQQREEEARLRREEERKRKLADHRPHANGVSIYTGTNGINGVNIPNGISQHDPDAYPDTTDAVERQAIETQAAQKRIGAAKLDADIAQWKGSIPWPMPENIRIGRMGELQEHFEANSRNNDELMAYVKKMVVDSELERASETGPESERPPQPRPPQHYPSHTQQTPQRPKKVVSLDFPEDDSDEEG